MQNLPPNPFFLLEVNDVKKEEDINKIFGLPKGVSEGMWPKRERQPMHHLITIDIRDLKLPLSEKKDILVLFFYFNEGKIKGSSETFKAVYLNYDEAYKTRQQSLPKDYEPVWNQYVNKEIIAHGLYYAQNEISNVSEEEMRELCDDEEIAELPRGLKKLRGTNSFIGGCPMWLQEPAYPKTDDGSVAFYFLMLNGFARYTQSTPFEGYDLFFFLDKNGKIYSVAQS